MICPVEQTATVTIATIKIVTSAATALMVTTLLKLEFL